MKKLKIIFCSLLLLSSITMIGQIERQNGLSITIKGPNTEIEGVTAVDATAKTQHLRFLTEGYQDANVNDLKDKFYFRYNIYEDEMEFVRDGTVYFLTKTENQLIKFLNSNRNFVVLNNENNLKYFEVNYKGKISLYTKQNVEFKEGRVAKTQFETAKESKFFRTKDTYYLSVNDGDLIELPKKEKDLLSLFGNKANEVKKKMKKEKLNRKNLNDIIKILEYYNTL